MTNVAKKIDHSHMQSKWLNNQGSRAIVIIQTHYSNDIWRNMCGGEQKDDKNINPTKWYPYMPAIFMYEIRIWSLPRLSREHIHQ